MLGKQRLELFRLYNPAFENLLPAYENFFIIMMVAYYRIDFKCQAMTYTVISFKLFVLLRGDLLKIVSINNSVSSFDETLEEAKFIQNGIALRIKSIVLV